MSKLFSLAVNTPAKAKLVYSKKLDSYKVIIAFNVTKRNKHNELIMPPQQQCAFISGDIMRESIQTDLPRVVNIAHAQLRTDNIEFI
jgi:hypothetical protein